MTAQSKPLCPLGNRQQLENEKKRRETVEREKEQMMREKEELMLRLQDYEQKTKKAEKELQNRIQRALQLEGSGSVLSRRLSVGSPTA